MEILFSVSVILFFCLFAYLDLLLRVQCIENHVGLGDDSIEKTIFNNEDESYYMKHPRNKVNRDTGYTCRHFKVTLGPDGRYRPL